MSFDRARRQRQQQCRRRERARCKYSSARKRSVAPPPTSASRPPITTAAHCQRCRGNIAGSLSNTQIAGRRADTTPEKDSPVGRQKEPVARIDSATVVSIITRVWIAEESAVARVEARTTCCLIAGT